MHSQRSDPIHRGTGTGYTTGRVQKPVLDLASVGEHFLKALKNHGHDIGTAAIQLVIWNHASKFALPKRKRWHEKGNQSPYYDQQDSEKRIYAVWSHLPQPVASHLPMSPHTLQSSLSVLPPADNNNDIVCGITHYQLP